jgi:hypothetical protein
MLCIAKHFLGVQVSRAPNHAVREHKKKNPEGTDSETRQGYSKRARTKEEE